MFNIITYVISIFVLLTLFKNYIFLLIAPWYDVMEKVRFIKATNKLIKETGNSEYIPLVSVVIPAWNEEVGILKTVDSVINNGYPNIQVIVVNDGSTDKTEKVVKKYIKNFIRSKGRKGGRKITYIYQTNGGKGVALNTGLKHAKGEILLTVDADSALQKGAIENLVKYYRDERIMAVVGNVQVVNTRTVVAVAQHLEYYLGFYNKRANAVLGSEYIFGGACASFRTKIFKEIGNFDTTNKTEDIEMSMRVRFYGYDCTYAEDVLCFTEGASDFKGLLSQRVRWKKGRLDTFSKYRGLFLSTNERHNFFLSFFILPFSLFAEIQLIFEPIAITVLLLYSLITLELLSLAIAITFIFYVYLITAFFSNKKVRFDLILMFPFTWPLFYFLDWIEFLALFKSLKMIRQKENVQWQKWKRVGI